MPDPGRITVILTGAAGWRRADGTAGTLSRKDAALLAMLALEGPSGRDQLASLLWPEASPTQAHNSLRQRLFRMRRDTGHDLVLQGNALTLAPGVDTDLSLAAIESDSGHDTGPAPSAGELLAGFDYGDSDALDRWVMQARQQWRQRRVDALTGRAAQQEACGAWAAALACTQAILELAPLQEHAWRRLMRLHYLRGDPAAALAAFEAFEAQLKQELGTRPSAETLEQLRLIESARVPAANHPRRLLPPSLVRPPQLVGRVHEWQLMQRAWDAGRAFVLVGHAGLGKSRLLEEFLSHQASDSALVLEQGRPGDASSPYATAARFMGKVLAQHPGACSPESRLELSRMLPSLGQAPTSPAQQATLWRAVEDVLCSAQQRGLAVMAVDDLQFADSATLDLLRWLVPSRRLMDLRLALATRPPADGEAAERMRDWWADSHRPEPVHLTPLTLTDVQQLLRSLALPEVHADQAAELMAHAGGEPFFVLETLKDLLLHGGVARGLPGPATVRALIDKRLQALPAHALDLMRVAAVADQDLTADRAARLLGTTALQLAAPWAALEAADVLHGTRFAHDLMRDAALAGTPAPVRRTMHAALAALLAEDPQVPHGRVAGHWVAAERWAEAGRSLLAAGRAAYRAGRLREHLDLLQQAADCSARGDDPVSRFDALCLRLDGLLVREGAQAVLDQVPLMEQLEQTPRQTAELLQVQCEALSSMARFDQVLALAPQLRQVSMSCDGLLADTQSMIGRALSNVGRHDEALATLTEARNLAERWANEQGDQAPLARSLGHLAYGQFNTGDTPAAMQTQREAAELALRLHDPADHAIHTGNLATLNWLSGDTPAAHHYALQARDSYRRVDARDGHAAAINNITLGLCAAHLGDFGTGLVTLRDAMVALGPGAPAAAVAKGRMACAGLWLQVGRPDEAAAVLMGPGLDSAALPAVWRAMWHLERARVLQALDQPCDAERSQGMEVAASLTDFSASPSLLRGWAEQQAPGPALQALRRTLESPDQRHRAGVRRALRLMLLAQPPTAGWTLDDIRRTAAEAQQDMGLPHHTSAPPLWAWAVLAEAHDTLNDRIAAAACRQAQARLAAATAQTLPSELRTAFLALHPAQAVTAG